MSYFVLSVHHFEILVIFLPHPLWLLSVEFLYYSRSRFLNTVLLPFCTRGFGVLCWAWLHVWQPLWFYPLDASDTPQKWQPQISLDIAKHPLGAKSSLIVRRWSLHFLLDVKPVRGLPEDLGMVGCILWFSLISLVLRLLKF